LPQTVSSPLKTMIDDAGIPEMHVDTAVNRSISSPISSKWRDQNLLGPGLAGAASFGSGSFRVAHGHDLSENGPRRRLRPCAVAAVVMFWPQVVKCCVTSLACEARVFLILLATSCVPL